MAGHFITLPNILTLLPSKVYGEIIYYLEEAHLSHEETKRLVTSTFGYVVTDSMLAEILEARKSTASDSANKTRADPSSHQGTVEEDSEHEVPLPEGRVERSIQKLLDACHQIQRQTTSRLGYVSRRRVSFEVPVSADEAVAPQPSYEGWVEDETPAQESLERSERSLVEAQRRARQLEQIVLNQYESPGHIKRIEASLNGQQNTSRSLQEEPSDEELSGYLDFSDIPKRVQKMFAQAQDVDSMDKGKPSEHSNAPDQLQHAQDSTLPADDPFEVVEQEQNSKWECWKSPDFDNVDPSILASARHGSPAATVTPQEVAAVQCRPNSPEHELRSLDDMPDIVGNQDYGEHNIQLSAATNSWYAEPPACAPGWSPSPPLFDGILIEEEDKDSDNGDEEHMYDTQYWGSRGC